MICPPLCSLWNRDANVINSDGSRRLTGFTGLRDAYIRRMHLNIVLQIMFSIRPLRQAVLSDRSIPTLGLSQKIQAIFYGKIQEIFYGLIKSDKPVGEQRP